MKRKESGFTMMELLIVVAVIMIISIVGVGNFLSGLRKGRDAQRKEGLSQIARALESYANDYGGYPESDNDGKIVGCDGVVPNTPESCDWGDPFRYNGNTY